MVRHMTIDRWITVLKLMMGVLVLGLVLTAYAQPTSAPPLNVGPLRPATAEEDRQWQVDRLVEEMEAGR